MENLKIALKKHADAPLAVITIATHANRAPGQRGGPVGAATFTHHLAPEGGLKMTRSAITGFIRGHNERETLLTSLRALQAYLRATPEGRRVGVIVCVNSLAFMDSLEATRAHLDAEKKGEAPAQLRNRTLWKSLFGLMEVASAEFINIPSRGEASTPTMRKAYALAITEAERRGAIAQSLSPLHSQPTAA